MIACDSCKNSIVNGEFLPRKSNIRKTPMCLAFPNGIPQDILDGALHREVRPDQDNDIVYDSGKND